MYCRSVLRLTQSYLWPNGRPIIRGSSCSLARHYSVPGHFQSKYAEKIRQLATEKGLSVAELKEIANKQREAETRRLREEKAALTTNKSQETLSGTPKSIPTATKIHHKSRKDSSPVKPLSSILNLPRVLSTPHTPDQIAQLWNAYHISRSGGTGRGFLCASIPLGLYKKMVTVAEEYPTFIVPIRRQKGMIAAEGEKDDAYEFYFLQWNFHDVPPVPASDESLFAKPSSPEPSNPRISTVLFTPLEEYKLRNTFATPHLVLTNYTDLASTHGLVLLRGEITSGSASGRNYLMSQADAQQLSMTLQKFYLWGGGDDKGERLVKTFHEKPEEFRWEDLLKLADWSA